MVWYDFTLTGLLLIWSSVSAGEEYLILMEGLQHARFGFTNNGLLLVR